MYLIKNTRGGVRPTAGKAPIETALDTALTLPEIRLHLQPLPAAGAKRKHDEEDSSAKSSTPDKTLTLSTQFFSVGKAFFSRY